MYQQNFIDRKKEIEYLNNRYRTGQPEFIVLYGRRRVGKTELMLKFMKEKPGIYFLASREGDRQNIKMFAGLMADILEDEMFEKVVFPDWYSLFIAFFNHNQFKEITKKDKFVIVIDEFPFLMNSNTAISSIFQKLWELNMKEENIMLILSGSSVSVMESEVLAYRSPLYGRRTGQWHISPLKFGYLKEFLPYSKEDLASIWFIVGGIPGYLIRFDREIPLWDNILHNMVEKGSYLLREADFILNEEFREPKNYKLIFNAIAQGSTTIGEICNATGLDKGMVSKYVFVLNRMHIIKEEIPVTASYKFKRRHYIIEDPYLNFWFRYIYPNRIHIEAGKEKEVVDTIKKEFQTYSGHMFEYLVNDILHSKCLDAGFNFTKIGRWWHKDKEIDIVALNENSKDILFLECKWKCLTKKQAENILRELKIKAESVDWNTGKRKEHFGITAKKIEGKEELKKKGYAVFDLDDF
ncbi:AAA family ATPase [archaeon]|nr:AAA family ATPase [archaeon]